MRAPKRPAPPTMNSRTVLQKILIQEHLKGKPALISRGGVSEVYHIKGTSVVVKIAVAGEGNYRKKAAIQSNAAKLGLAPKPLKQRHIEGIEYAVEEHIEGKPLRAGKLTVREIKAVNAFYRKLGRHRSGNAKEIANIQYWIGRTEYLKRLERTWGKDVTLLPKRVLREMHNFETQIREHIERNAHEFIAVPRTLMHGDANPANLFFRNGKIIAIDWVDKDGPLCLDATDFLNKGKMTPKQEKLFIAGLAKPLRKPTLLWRPVRSYTGVWWNLHNYLLRTVKGHKTVYSKRKTIMKAKQWMHDAQGQLKAVS